jgi:hypothetical protein
MKFSERLYQVLVALDQLANTIRGLFAGNSYADETLSAFYWRTRETNKYAYRVIDFLFFWEEDHCMNSFISECLRMQAPPETRQCHKES